MNTPLVSHPFLTDAEASAWEARLLGNDEQKQYAAMARAGKEVGRQLAEDLKLLRAPTTADPLKILLLLGKGHNAGDALLALKELHTQKIPLFARCLFAFGERSLKPLTRRAFEECLNAEVPLEYADFDGQSDLVRNEDWDVCIDGLFGLSFRSPLPSEAVALIEAVNTHPRIFLRAAIDYPSGLNDQTLLEKSAPIFRADFTYQTGIPKETLLHPKRAADVGRLRYADIGFFDADTLAEKPLRLIVKEPLLKSLAALREADCDKRDFGHCFILSGSQTMAGAHLMNVQAALRSGAGLVSALCPGDFVPAFCAQEPGALWSTYPANPQGGASSEGSQMLLEKLIRATAFLAGSGMGRSADTAELLQKIAREAPCPLVFDADALTPELIDAIGQRPADTPPCILTPHLGEYARINPGNVHGDANALCNSFGAVLVLKAARTQIFDGQNTYVNICGSPALARGGSGDVLAGLIAGLLAQCPQSYLKAAAAAVVWHGVASECAERASTQRTATMTELVGHLGTALKR